MPCSGKIFIVPDQEGIDRPHLPPQVRISSDVFIENGLDSVHMEKPGAALAGKAPSDIPVPAFIRHPDPDRDDKAQLFAEGGIAGKIFIELIIPFLQLLFLI